jgi:hypothetical protein
MKKLLLTIFLSLVCITSAFSKNKKEIALENCADETFINYEDESYKKTMGSARGTIVRNWGKIKRGEELLNQGYALNEKADKAAKAYEGKEVPEQVLKGFSDMRYRARNYIIAGYNHYGLYADEIVKKTSINKKTKNEEYANFLINCEKLHSETPYGFELKWGNK